MNERNHMSNESTTEVATTKLDPMKEIKEIPGLVQDIIAFLEPGTLEAKAQELNETYGKLTIAGHVDGKEAGLAAVKDALNKHFVKFRTGIEADHARLKAPFWNGGKALDKRKNEGIALTAPLEARLRKEIADHEAELARLAAEEEAKRKALTNARLQFAMQKGIVVDATDAEQMGQDEWDAHCAALIQAKAEADDAEAKRVAAQQKIQAQIIKRMESASKLGAHITREDAEYLTEEEFLILEGEWRSRKEEEDRQQAEILAIKDLKDRASAQGFLLLDQDIAGWEDREAGFMVWLAEKVKERQAEQSNRQKQDWLLERSALLKEGETVSVKVLMEATPEEWTVIYRQLLEERESKKVVPVAPIAAPAPAAPAVDPGLSSGGTNPAAPANVTPAQVAAALDNKGDLLSIIHDFAAFGKSLPTEELKASLRPIYNRMKQLAERL